MSNPKENCLLFFQYAFLQSFRAVGGLQGQANDLPATLAPEKLILLIPE